MVRVTKVGNRKPHRECERERDPRKNPGCQKLAHNSRPERHGQREQKLDRANPALFRPKPHADSRDQEEVEPRMKLEKAFQVCLTGFKMPTHVEGEAPHTKQKDHNKDEGERCRKIARKLTLENCQHLSHAASSPACSFSAVSDRVSERNTSSRRPGSP